MLSFFTSQSMALTDGKQLVEKMSESAKTLDYQGYFNYDRGQISTSYRIVHKVEEGVEKQRLVFMDGEPLEIINDGHSLRCIHPGEAGLNAHTRADSDPFINLGHPEASIWKFYNAEITGKGRIADRPVVRVHLKPRDPHRYPFVFFIDEETGLMLKMLVLDHKDRPLERFHYVFIEYGNVQAKDLEPAIKNYTIIDHGKPGEVSGLQQEDNWVVAWIPEGFNREKASMKQNIKPSRSEQAYMFSDGLSAFSVFIEPGKASQDKSTSTRMGGTSAISHYASFNGKPYLVTVIGEIPLMTAKQIALSVRPAT